jgi:4'-phosphopantetheinyl transferase
VGIDIERMRPRIEKVRERFLHTEESASINKDKVLEQLTLAWCAKEALYKLYGQRNLDFRENIRVEIPDCAGMTFKAEIRFGGNIDKYQLYSEMIGNYIMVYLLSEAI